MNPKKIIPPAPLNQSKFGIDSAAQWLLVSPARYEDYTKVVTRFDNFKIDAVLVITGVIKCKNMFDSFKNKTTDPRRGQRIVVTLTDKEGYEVDAAAFGRPGFDWLPFHVNDTVTIRGTVSIFNNQYQISGAKIVQKNLLGRVIPIYGPIRGTAGARFNEMVDKNVDFIDVAGNLVEYETGWGKGSSITEHPIFNRYKTAADLIEELHDPSTLESGLNACKAASLLSAYSLIRKAKIRSESKEPVPKSIILIPTDAVEYAMKLLPFPPTNDQNAAMHSIAKALRSPMPLSGILSGDVGSGKTATFLVPLIAAHKMGSRCMIMAPNLLLIKQIAAEIRQYFPGIPVCSITGDGIDGDPDNSIIVGTTALVGWVKKNPIKRKPNFLVIDEQQRFSVDQKNALAAEYTNVLEATATPIPRTAALVAYGDKSLFILRQIPVKKNIETFIVSNRHSNYIENSILQSVLGGTEQAAIIYPLVSGKEEEDSAVSVGEAFKGWSELIPHHLIAVLHGKLTDAEKVEVIRSFKAGEKKLLLASTVIEVGITLPDLKKMLVVDADKFGLVTLHQLRGRLARLGGEGVMMLFVEDEQSESIERLEILVKHSDGFSVSEKDAEQRGFGDFLSTDGDEQSGKTKSLFMGVKIGPLEIDAASKIMENMTKPTNTSQRVGFSPRC